MKKTKAGLANKQKKNEVNLELDFTVHFFWYKTLLKQDLLCEGVNSFTSQN